MVGTIAPSEAVAVIVAVPGVTEVTKPLASTVAIAVLSEDQVTVAPINAALN